MKCAESRSVAFSYQKFIFIEPFFFYKLSGWGFVRQPTEISHVHSNENIKREHTIIYHGREESVSTASIY